MPDLEQLAYSLGLDWVEEKFRSLFMKGLLIPVQWPGTLEESRDRVSAFVGDTLDFGDREWLVYKTQTRAEALWPEFRGDLERGDLERGDLEGAAGGPASQRS